ncbi:unnamed protein product [Urochloa humidicola]
MCCPCKVCENKKEFRRRDTLFSHIYSNGFMSNYTPWSKHGEVRVVMEENEDDDDGDNQIPDWAWVHEAGGFDEAMDEGESNCGQEESPDELAQALLDAQKDSETEKKRLNFEKMLEDHKRPLYPGCKPEQKKLGTALEMLK